ncbi:MAG: lysophospholipid acyltransferase family protein [Vicinamibacteria bacterium]|nr:lysophospholipid acyltransferase family protein [Vicinamibacteria bacterium]
MRRMTKHRIENVVVAAFSALVRLMPRRVALGLGAGLGRLLGRFDRRHVTIAEENLRHAFPAWSAKRRERVARRVYAHFGRILFDILWFACRSPRAMLSVVDFEGIEHYQAAVEAGRGILYVTAHLGNWEFHAVGHSLLHAPLGVVARPLDNPMLDARLCAFRRAGGNTVVYKQHAVGQVMRILRGGGAVAVLIDQNVRAREGIFIDFFGRPAATTTVAAALAIKTGCLVLPVRAVIRPDGRYRLIYEAPLRWEATGDRRGDVARITQELSSLIEQWIRETPEQWLWIHRRWKTRPEDDSPSKTPAIKPADD